MFADASIYFGVALAGLASFLSPCVLPLVPPYLSYIGGTTLDQMTGEGDIDRDVWRRVVLAALVFVLGFTTVFVALGAGASTVGQILLTHKATLGLAAGAIITVFGLHFLGVLHIPLLHTEARFHTAAEDGATLTGAYVMGLAFAFGWTPCIGPILMTVLSVAANENSISAGVSLLFVYALGLGVPFVLAAIAIRPFLGFMTRFKRHFMTLEKIMGLVLVMTGLLFMGQLLGDVRAEAVAVMPGLEAYGSRLGVVLTVIGGAAMVASTRPFALAGFVVLVVGMTLTGGSINGLGQWMLETFPSLASVENWVTPDGLSQDILQKGAPTPNP